jgi:twitching motility protein PilT
VNLVDSLLEAVSRLEGDALIMHVGEKPYVVTTSASMYAYRGPLVWGHVELSSRVLTTETVAGMLEHLLPSDQLRALVEYGAIEYELPHRASSDRFTVVAARGGDDVWLELRRTPTSLGTTEAEQAQSTPKIPEATIPEPAIAAAATPEPAIPERAIPAVAIPAVSVPEDARTEAAVPEQAAPAMPEAEPTREQIAHEPESVAATSEAHVVEQAAPESDVPETHVPETDVAQAASSEPAVATETAVTEPEPELDIDLPAVAETPTTEVSEVAEPIAMERNREEETAAFEIVEDEPQATPTDAEVEELLTASASAILIGATQEAVEPAASSMQQVVADEVAAAEQPEAMPEIDQDSHAPQPVAATAEPRHGVVLPMSRPTVVPEPPVQIRPVSGTPLERILRIAAARGAATVYVVAQSHPVIRVDGEISMLDSEPVLSAADIERLIKELAPEHAEGSASEEWMTDVPEVGRVRCVTFRDERGPGVIFRMTPPKAISADQLGIPPDVQALCAQPDGLVLVTGARASGKSTLLNAFVDLINRTRSDHIITIESQIGFVHEGRRSFISQREVKGPEAAAGAVRSAFREDPDVLVIDDIRTPEVVVAAFEAAEAGRLVFGAVTASSTIAALDRVIELFPAGRRGQVQASLAEALRGVVAQMLLRRVRGGRIAAREILLNTPVVAGLIIEGKTTQLPVALDSGRRHGMVPLADSFAALVREGTVHAAEAYRKTPDRAALLAALRADGIDTSFAERLA